MIDFKNILPRRGKADDPDDYTPLFDGSDDDPNHQTDVESWGSIILGWVKNLLGAAALGVLFVSVLYTLLAIFLIILVPIGSDAGFTEREAVTRNTWAKEGGTPPVGAKAVVSLTETTDNTAWWQYALYGWTRLPATAEVEILSSDRDKLFVETVDTGEADDAGKPVKTGKVTILTKEGQPVFDGFTGSLVYDYDPNSDPITPATGVQLDGQLLASCVAGDCQPGSVFIIDLAQVFGERNAEAK